MKIETIYPGFSAEILDICFMFADVFVLHKKGFPFINAVIRKTIHLAFIINTYTRYNYISLDSILIMKIEWKSNKGVAWFRLFLYDMDFSGWTKVSFLYM